MSCFRLSLVWCLYNVFTRQRCIWFLGCFAYPVYGLVSVRKRGVGCYIFLSCGDWRKASHSEVREKCMGTTSQPAYLMMVMKYGKYHQLALYSHLRSLRKQLHSVIEEDASIFASRFANCVYVLWKYFLWLKTKICTAKVYHG